MQTITRKIEFDAAHRVMNEKMLCYNLHGHRYVAELTFQFSDMKDIGYPIDFKEIKRIGCQFIDDYLDHGTIINPKDKLLLEYCIKLGSKFWIMSLNSKEYCNPTVENIGREIFLMMQILFSKQDIDIYLVKLYETPNCFTMVDTDSIPKLEKELFYNSNKGKILDYAKEKGELEYDDRK